MKSLIHYDTQQYREAILMAVFEQYVCKYVEYWIPEPELGWKRKGSLKEWTKLINDSRKTYMVEIDTRTRNISITITLNL